MFAKEENIKRSRKTHQSFDQDLDKYKTYSITEEKTKIDSKYAK